VLIFYHTNNTTIPMNSINFLPIFVASVVAFGLSSLWYSPILFGREWLKLQKISDQDLAARKETGIIKSYIVQFIMTLVTFSVLAFIISFTAIRNSADGAFLGALAWLGFILANSIGEVLWSKKPLTLVLIDSINYLIILTIGGAIIGAWR